MRGTTRAIASALVAGTLLVAGCGDDTGSPSEEGLEALIEQQGGGDVDLDMGDDGEFSMESEDGSFSTGTEIPDSWPDDVPLPDSLEIESASEMLDNTTGSGIITVSGRTSAAPDDVAEFYSDALGDWEEAMNMSSSSGGAASITQAYEQEGRIVTVNATEDGDATSVIVSVSLEGS